MMKQFGLLCGIYAAAVLETDPAGWSAHSRIAVCPLYLVACAAVWTQTPLPAILWAAGIGLIADTLSTGPLGIETVLVATAAWWAARLRTQHEWRSVPAFGLCSVSLVAGLSLASQFVRSNLSGAGVPTRDLLLSCTGSALATGLCGLLILIAVRTLHRAMRRLATDSY